MTVADLITLLRLYPHPDHEVVIEYAPPEDDPFILAGDPFTDDDCYLAFVPGDES